MNLTAKTGLDSVGGIALLMLLISVQATVRKHPTHDAYAPLPIVFETMRKGKSFGSGSSCDIWKAILVTALTMLMFRS